MRHQVGIIVGAMLLMGLIAPALSSQTPAARTEIVAAAVRYAVDQLGSEWAHLSGPVLFDPRVLESRFMSHPAYENPIKVYELGAPRDPQVTGELLRLISAQPGDFDLATVCASNEPGTCTLGGAVAIFAASDPVMRGDTAEVVISGEWRTSLKKMPVAAGRIAVTLVQSGGRWEARKSRMLSIT